jgi:hypothetical protein
MNATFATPRTPTTISMACPWCDEPLAVEDAFAAPAVRCAGCATSIDLEPAGVATSGPAVAIAA